MSWCSTRRPAISQHAGANAVDGDPRSRWGSAHSDPQWITVDLGTPRVVNRVEGTQRATQWGYSLWDLKVIGPEQN